MTKKKAGVFLMRNKIVRAVRVGFLCLEAVLFFLLVFELFPYRPLYFHFERLTVGKLLLFVLALLLFVFACFCGRYVFRNLDGKLTEIIVPFLARTALFALSFLFLALSVNGIVYKSLTGAEFYDPDVEPSKLYAAIDGYAGAKGGTVTDYAYYEQGDCAGEELTVAYDADSFRCELIRIAESSLEKENQSDLCYQWRRDNSVTQIRVDPETMQVVYGRYVLPDQLPAFAPHPGESRNTT